MLLISTGLGEGAVKSSPRLSEVEVVSFGSSALVVAIGCVLGCFTL